MDVGIVLWANLAVKKGTVDSRTAVWDKFCFEKLKGGTDSVSQYQI